MKTKILLAFFCLLSITSFCQDSVFQLKDYKYRTKGFKSLALQFSFRGLTNNYKRSSTLSQKETLFDLYPSYISYTNVLSTDKRFHTSFFSLSPSARLHVQKNEQNKYKGTDYQSTLSWNFDDRFYRKNNWFWHVGNDFYSKFDFVKVKSGNVTTKTSVPGVNESLLLGFGKGRLEMVQDAQMALFILNDLKHEGLLDIAAGAELVNEFAQLITEINNRRVLDSRRKRIYELTQIEKFLKEKGIATTADIRQFAIINDNWAFAFNPYRLSGSSWHFNINSSVSVGKGKQTITEPGNKTVNEDISKLYGTGPSITYQNHKPKSLKWQRDFGVVVSWQTSKSELINKNSSSNGTLENTTKQNQNRSELSAVYGFGFFPNNRTKLNASLNLNAESVKYKSGSIDGEVNLNPAFNFSTDYFLSYKTRLTANINTWYSYEHTKPSTIPHYTTNSFHTNFSVGLLHYFL